MYRINLHVHFRRCLSENDITSNAYIAHTTTTLSRSLNYHLSDISAIKKHLITKYNKESDKLNSQYMRNILINNTKMINRNNNKSRLQIPQVITIKKTTMNKISFTRKYHHHHHYHITLVARISLTLSRHSSLSFIALGRSSGQHPVSSHSC